MVRAAGGVQQGRRSHRVSAKPPGRLMLCRLTGNKQTENREREEDHGPLPAKSHVRHCALCPASVPFACACVGDVPVTARSDHRLGQCSGMSHHRRVLGGEPIFLDQFRLSAKSTNATASSVTLTTTQVIGASSIALDISPAVRPVTKPTPKANMAGVASKTSNPSSGPKVGHELVHEGYDRPCDDESADHRHPQKTPARNGHVA
jgi:hypothetical protein